MKTKNYILRLLIGGIFAFTPAVAQQVLTHNGGLSVFPTGINLRGDVVGGISDISNQNRYGFYYLNNGQSASVAPLSSFCQPGACALPSEVVATAINNSGLIVGSWEDASYVSHAFFRDERGRITKFDAPNLSRTNPTYVTPGMVINGNGDMAGHFMDTANVAHIFYRTAKGQVTTYDIPGSQGLGVFALNNSGVIAGFYIGADGRSRGFMLSVGGRKSTPVLTSCDYPASVNGQTLTAINNNGIAVGYYFDASFGYHSIRCNPNGATFSLDYGPAGTTTLVQAINDNNAIAFVYVDGPVETTTAQTVIRTLP